jgi:sulfite exporter TauE/SafE
MTAGIGLLAGLLAAGFAGSFMHCGPMCGAFVLASAADRMAALDMTRLTAMSRLRAGLNLPYHLGRVITYTLLGGAAGGLTAGIGATQGLRPILLLAASFVYAAFALRRLAPQLAGLLPLHASPQLTAAMARASRGIDPATPLGGMVMGMMLGFLPCGLLYGALATAAATASLLWGALAMLAFGIGTVPVLAAIGIAGHSRSLTPLWQVTAPMILGLNAVVLAVRALAEPGRRRLYLLGSRI